MVEWVCFGNGGGVKMKKDFTNEIKKCLTNKIENTINIKNNHHNGFITFFDIKLASSLF